MTQQSSKADRTKVLQPVKKVLEWGDLSDHQQMIVREGRKVGILVPPHIKTAEQYADWMETQM